MPSDFGSHSVRVNESLGTPDEWIVRLRGGVEPDLWVMSRGIPPWSETLND
jgi:hypothetical protein